MQDQELRTWDDGLDHPGTVGELIEFLQDIDPTLPVYFTYDMGHGVAPMRGMDFIAVKNGRAGPGLYIEND